MVLTVAMSNYASHMPDIKDLRAADPDNASACADLRIGELVAGLMTISTGALGSVLVKNWLPMWIAIGSVMGLTALYEGVLRTNIVLNVTTGRMMVTHSED